MRNLDNIHDNVDLSFFDSTEKDIIYDVICKDWYVTTSKEIRISRSYYKAILAKPISNSIQEMFNLKQEIVIIFSPYEDFEPRSMDAIEEVRETFTSSYQSLRIEEVCSVMISKDKEINSIIRDLFKSNRESQIVVPFSYEELSNSKRNNNCFLNKFREFFYTRDLFEFESAIQKELYFFGRKSVVHELVNRHLSNENSGLFGLRKSGKTSIIFAIERVLKVKKSASVFINCENIYKKRWNEALYYIIYRLASKYGVKIKNTEESYTESKVDELFVSDLKSIYSEIGKKNILIIFDEIEQITFKIGVNKNWRKEKDFIHFWHSLRNAFQETKTVFTYLIAGTNPMPVEEQWIDCQEGDDLETHQNPIYLQVPFQYIQPFDVQDTKEMINKLGNYLGLSFDDIVCANITQDYGGHPFLIRHVCSIIHKLPETQSRPLVVNRIIYNIAKPIFEIKQGEIYTQLILDVLEKFYNDEYFMLQNLAIGNLEFFNSFAENPYNTNHLLNYGIIEKVGEVYDFKIDTLKVSLAKKNKYSRLRLSTEDKWAEISERRNNIELKLGRMVRMQLLTKYNREEAKKIVIKRLDSKKQTKYIAFPYEDLFDTNKFEMYFDVLRDLAVTNWEECFRNIFETDKEKFNSRMLIINELRAEAHAKSVSDADMSSFRGAMTWLEDKVSMFFK